MHDFKEAKKVTILLDNLNTHTKGALYTRFEPEYCREILRRCEFVYTPIHGCWLQCCLWKKELICAESELSVLTKQCLCGRIGNIDEVCKQIPAWTNWRNDHTPKAPTGNSPPTMPVSNLTPFIQYSTSMTND